MTLALRYDPLDPAMLEDPYPLYRALRESTPVFWHEQTQSWVLTRYRDCRDVLRDYDLFARDRRRVGEDVPDFRQSVQTLDPPAQGPLRRLFVSSLREQDFDELAGRARLQISQVFGQLSGRDRFDWMREVAAPVALSLTAELIGVDEPELNPYVEISEALARRMDAALLPETADPGDRARKAFNALVSTWFAGDGRDGALACIRHNAAGAKVSDHYVRNTTSVTFNASFGTVFAAAGNIALTLLQRPEALEQLRDPRILESGVEELIRFDGPAQGTSRVAIRKTTIGDTIVEPGQVVLTLLAAANRDPDEFPRPDELVLDRTPNRHLGFGWGPHACLGMLFGHLAVRELVVGMLATPGRLRLAGTPIRRRTATVRCLEYLPVTLRP
ncbi:MAG TPA: cytochrome P450 [Streptosporangiaceae bacterium]|nr:cytochrome P450 [Streptosporangiaceae bacterium]